MASWQAHVATFLVRRMVKTSLVRSPTVATIRKVFNANQPSVSRGCVATQESIGGIRCERMIANDGGRVGTLLYLHGGAFVACSPATHRPLTSWFAKQGWEVVVPDYRLAPEYCFPAQIEDALAAYRALLDNGVDSKRMVVAGDSAGGNLSLALCLSLRTLGIPLPSALALFSPVTDFSWSGASSTVNSDRCAMFSKDILPIGAQLYLRDHDPRDPLASPFYADLQGLPPMLFHVGADEILLDDSVRVAARAVQAGLKVELKVWPIVPHVWQLFHRWIPEGSKSLKEAHAFLRRYIASQS